MAYCLASDVLVNVPQAADGETFEAYIAISGGIIDAHLGETYKIPMFGGVVADVCQHLKTIAAQLAAGKYLLAELSQCDGKPDPYAVRLINEAMKAIAEIKANPGMVPAELVDASDIDDDTSAVSVTEPHISVFGAGDETTWGLK